MNAAILEVNVEMLIDELGLPDDVDIRDVRMSFEVPGRVCFVIHHKSLPKIRPGETFQRVSATYEDGDFVAFI